VRKSDEFGGKKMSNIASLLEKHKEFRTSGLNLIASENTLSLEVKKALASDLAGRYHSEWYGGSRYAIEIIKETENLAKKVFKVKHAIVTSLSGNMCDLAVMFAFTKPGDKVAMVHFEAGGYPLGLSKFHRQLLPISADPNTFEVDAEGTIKIVMDEKPPLTIIGASFIPFPHPVRKISEGIKNTSVCVYDGSHILGLIPSGTFQDPIREGAEVLIGSTHKSLYGPQGGLVLTDSDSHNETLRKMLDFDLDEGIGLVDNPHMNRVAALGMALEELDKDSDYGIRVVKNAKALAEALDDLSVPVKFKERGFTESHQIFLDLNEEEAKSLCQSLENGGIFVDIACRIGVAEITHLGMGASEMDFIAETISDVFQGKVSSDLKLKVTNFVKKFS
jgi:glycine hydroxymethyltransferase